MSEFKQRRRFDAQFKLDAVRLLKEGNRRTSEIAKDLGVNPELLYRWKRELEEDPQHAFPGKGRLKPDEDELRKLQQELKRVTEERDILKKALAFFSRNAR
jgi:transposase